MFKILKFLAKLLGTEKNTTNTNNNTKFDMNMKYLI